ncbi:hypothetical protein ACFQ05_22790 [Amycolatopsis umgeniensis]|uniref:Uncharacterized protein n=1 Tax=Amycolatopsis umgeniensis TaxID=336628 RepID=A0A841AUR6_9PSEU|nr:hypothetical protein [Amycolatopsis umgeniensis]MBB5850034.1 hypothetical protein [Amycolatopsis umgeniensis]
MSTASEEKVMTQSPNSMGQSVSTSVTGVRELAAEAGKAGAEAVADVASIAERKFSEAADEVTKTTRRARRDFVRQTRKTRKEIRENSSAVRDETLTRMAGLREPGRRATKAAVLAAKSTREPGRRGKRRRAAAKANLGEALAEAKSVARGEGLPRSRPRWPWIVVLGVVAAGATYILRTKKKPSTVEFHDEPHTIKTAEDTPASSEAVENGRTAPEPTAAGPKN